MLLFRFEQFSRIGEMHFVAVKWKQRDLRPQFKIKILPAFSQFWNRKSDVAKQRQDRGGDEKSREKRLLARHLFRKRTRRRSTQADSGQVDREHETERRGRRCDVQ